MSFSVTDMKYLDIKNEKMLLEKWQLIQLKIYATHAQKYEYMFALGNECINNTQTLTQTLTLTHTHTHTQNL